MTLPVRFCSCVDGRHLCFRLKAERANLVDTLSASHEMVYITRAQVDQLCGNVLEVHGEPYTKRIMCMSTRAYDVCDKAN